jgi:hypothetical protein
MLKPDQMDAMPSQREGQLDDDADTKLLTNPLAQSQSPANSEDHSPASAPLHNTGRLSMAWKRSVDSSRAGLEIQPRRLTGEAHVNS